MASGNPSIEPETRAATRGLAAASIGAVAIGVLLREAWRYRGFYSDDSLISLRYAERLLAGKGLTWNDGEFVEGYSNLLWVLASALLGGLGIDLQDATRILGVLGMGGAIGAVVWLYAPARWSHSLPALAAGLAMALTGPFAIWTVGGLEQPMLVGLLASSLVLLTRALESQPDRRQGAIDPRKLLPASVLLGLICPTRPDGPLLVGAVCLGVVLAGGLRGSAWRSALVLAAPGALMFSAQLAFRLFYYDAWVPNTAHSKLALSTHRLTQGFDYWISGVRAMWPIALPALAAALAAIRLPELRLRVALWTPPIVVWSLWVIAVGGDIFPGRRHLVTVVLGFAVLSAELLRIGLARTRGAARATVVVAALLCLVALGHAQRTRDPAHTRALLEVPWAMGGEALGRLLGEVFAQQQPLVAVTAAGSIPYYSKLPALDMLGLNDRYLATHPPRHMGRGRIGHELGNGAYFLRRAPDLVVFCGTTGGATACSRGGREMQTNGLFERAYTPVSLLTESPISTTARLFVSTHSEKVGIRWEVAGSRMVVPGYLFSDFEGARAARNDAGELGVVIDPVVGARLSVFYLPPGEWRARAEGEGNIVVTLAIEGEAAEPHSRLQLTGSSNAPIVVTLSTKDEVAHVVRVIVERRR